MMEITRPDGTLVAVACGANDDEIQKNAHLIAAAEDLLAITEEALALMPLGTAKRARWAERASAVIARAKGQA